VALTNGARNLSRVFKLTANLLFEKGEDVQNVCRLLEGFVERRQIQAWYEKYCSTNGVPTTINLKKNKRRVPMPPIDWQAVKLEDLNEMLDNQQKPKVRDDLW
jgi:hypothetical protein